MSNSQISQVKIGVILNYTLIVINTVVALVYTPYMLRKLGQSEFGIYSLAASVIAYLTLMDFGFGNALIRYTAKFRAEGEIEQQSNLFGLCLKLYSIIGIVVFAIGLILYFNIDWLFDRTMTATEIHQIRVIVLIMVFNVAITFPFSIFGSIITAYERFVFQKTLNIIRIFLNTLVMVLLLSMGYKAIAMVVVQTIFNIIVLGLNFYYCRHFLKISISFKQFDKGFVKEIAIYSFWIFLNAIMDRIYWSTGQFVLGSIVGAVAVAIFSLGIHLQSFYMTFSTAISGVFLPRVTGMVAKGNTEADISNMFIKTGRFQYIVIAFILSGFIVFGKPFIFLWAGPGYDASYYITLIFFGSLMIPLIQNIGITILQARNQMKFRSLLYIVIALVSLGAQIYLSKYYGPLGCAIAIGGALVLGQGLIMNIYYWKRQQINIPRFWGEIIKMSLIPICLTVIGIFVVEKTHPYTISSLAISILIYSLIYMPLFCKFSLNEYEKNLILSPVFKVLHIRKS